MRRARAWTVAVAVAVALSGCFWFHSDYPDDSCSTNLDCFRAQGEVCNRTTNRCEVAPDAGGAPPTVDAAATPDAAPTTPDAAAPDAGLALPDAGGADA